MLEFVNSSLDGRYVRANRVDVVFDSLGEFAYAFELNGSIVQRQRLTSDPSAMRSLSAPSAAPSEPE